MPVKREYQPVTVNVSDGGKLLPDLPVSRLSSGSSYSGGFNIGQFRIAEHLANYTAKSNWERFDGTERKRCGWDIPAPSETWLADQLGRFDPAIPGEAIRGIRRPNGLYAVVGCGGGLIKAFNYDLNQWVTIGTGYSVDGDLDFRFWQIIDIAGYALFNNGRDLPCTWQVGDAAVKPIYEMREQGYAAVGTIVEYYGVLICANILEIDPLDMSALMNSATPYRTITEADGFTLTRIGFERIWSNIGNPRDFAAVVNGSIGAYYSESDSELTLEWPMASFEVGDQIIILGAGAAGGNLTTTITSIDGVYLTVDPPAQTSVLDAQVSKATALDSIVGSDELEGDGSEILIEMPLKNQLVSYKVSGEIFQSYYTASTTQPFASQRMSGSSGAKRPIRFPRALVNVLDQYHLFPGAAHFYRYELSAQEPVQESIFLGAEKTLFFDRVTDAGQFKVWAADNQAVGEIFFAYPLGNDEYEAGYEYSARRALVLNYNEGQESLDDVDGFNFLCAATVNKPIAGNLPDPTEQWFLMAGENGTVTLYGRSNTTLYTMRRYGELFDSTLEGGINGFGTDTIDKYFKRLTVLMADPTSTGKMTLYLYGTRSTGQEPVLLGSKDMVDPIFPAMFNAYFRQPYFKYRFVCSLDEPVRVQGMVWLIAGVDINQISQISQ